MAAVNLERHFMHEFIFLKQSTDQFANLEPENPSNNFSKLQ